MIYNFRFDRKDDDKEMLARGFSLVGLNRRAGYAQMARLVKGLGHRRILLGDAHEDSPLSLDGQFLEAMNAEGLKADLAPRSTVVKAALVDRGREAGRYAARSFQKKGYSLLCFRDDEVAGGAIAELRAKGVEVPEDIAVVSMDGHPLSGIFQVPLTTFAVPVEPMVAKTIALVREDGAPGAFSFPYKLIRRESHQAAFKK